MVDRIDLERLLNHPLPQAGESRVASLNEVPEALVEEARRLGTPLLARSLLTYYTSAEDRPFLKNFLDDVVFGKHSPAQWRRGGVLVPALSLTDQLCLSRDALLALIGGYAGLRVVPQLASWQAGTSWVGAPARPFPEANYRTVTPAGAARLAAQARLEAADLVVTLRRWIAARLARVVAPRTPGSLDELFEASSLASIDQWSEDARRGVGAVLREFREMGPADQAIPGFRGPDSWFEG